MLNEIPVEVTVHPKWPCFESRKSRGKSAETCFGSSIVSPLY